MPTPDREQMFSSSSSSTKMLFLGSGAGMTSGDIKTGFFQSFSLGAVQLVGAGLGVSIHGKTFPQVPARYFCQSRD